MRIIGVRLTIITAVCFVLVLSGAGPIVASSRFIPVSDTEPNDDCTTVQDLGNLVAGDPHMISGSIDPADIVDLYLFSADTGFLTVTLHWDCVEDLDLYLGQCSGGTFSSVASSTGPCPAEISMNLTTADDWVIMVAGNGVTSTVDYSIVVAYYYCFDGDGDQHFHMSCGGDDCDDDDDSIYPGATETIGDGVDQDCDTVESCYEDLDLDGRGSHVVIDADALDCDGPGVSYFNDDCNDQDDEMYPGAIEICLDGRDNDCNGFPDMYDTNCDGFDETVIAMFDCEPASGTLPFQSVMTVQLSNLYYGELRRIAARVDVTIASGASYSNWKSGWTNVEAEGHYNTFWNQNFPALGSVVGNNVFTLLAEDVTPSPYNQPPHPQAGGTDSVELTIVGIAP